METLSSKNQLLAEFVGIDHYPDPDGTEYFDSDLVGGIVYTNEWMPNQNELHLKMILEKINYSYKIKSKEDFALLNSFKEYVDSCLHDMDLESAHEACYQFILHMNN
jgi:hypothetical protein